VFGKCQTFVLRYDTVAGRDSAQQRALHILIKESGYVEEPTGSLNRILKSRRGEYLYFLNSGRYLLLVSGVDREGVLGSGKRLKTVTAGLKR